MYAFGPPGWSHDGSTKTVKHMRRSAKREKEVTKNAQESLNSVSQ